MARGKRLLPPDFFEDGATPPSPSATSQLTVTELREKRALLLKVNLGYADSDNPFKDAELSKPFIWKKRVEKQLAEKQLAEMRLAEKQLVEHSPHRNNCRAAAPNVFVCLEQTEERLKEISAVRQRREEREVEERKKEEAKARRSHDRETQSYDDWQRLEDKFHREINQLRIKIRIEQAREDLFHYLLKILELSARNTRGPEEYAYANMDIPHLPVNQVLQTCDDDQLKVLGSDVTVRLKVDRRELSELLLLLDEEEEENPSPLPSSRRTALNRLNRSIVFWKMLLLLTSWEIRQRENREAGRKEIPAFVEAQLNSELGGKSEQELEELEAEVQDKLQSGSSEIDVDFFENVRLRIPIYKAMTHVNRRWKEAQEGGGVCVDILALMASRRLNEAMLAGGQGVSSLGLAAETQLGEPRVIEHEGEGATGTFSPIKYEEGGPFLWEGVEVSAEALDEEEEDSCFNISEAKEWLLEGVDNLLAEGAGVGAPSTQLTGEADEDSTMLFERFVAREKALNVAEDEMILEGQEIDLMNESGGGAVTDKYQLRKPRYFNRVRTGFEWNRYNQAHYDQDNPPPRIVQGYKFTISYPHLLNPKQTPNWRLCASPEGDDGTVILRFHGGPPYEDIAFRIVKREWDLNPRRGYRNAFDQGILQLHFNFKRLRYRK